MPCSLSCLRFVAATVAPRVLALALGFVAVLLSLGANSRQHSDRTLQLLQLAVRVTLMNRSLFVAGQRHPQFLRHAGIGKNRRERVPQRVKRKREHLAARSRSLRFSRITRCSMCARSRIFRKCFDNGLIGAALETETRTLHRSLVLAMTTSNLQAQDESQ